MARYKDTGEPISIRDEDAVRVIQNAAPHWRLPLRLIYCYGMRASELLSLTPANVRDGVLTVIHLKPGKDKQGRPRPPKITRHQLLPEFKDELIALAASKMPTARLFSWTRKALWEAIQSAGFRAGVDRRFLHPHSFRHRCGRRMAAQGATIHQMMSVLGHKTVQMSLLYTELESQPELSLKFRPPVV